MEQPLATNTDSVNSLCTAVHRPVGKGARTKAWATAWLIVAAVAVPASGADDRKSPLATLVPGDPVRVEVAGHRRTLAATVESVTADELVLRAVGTVEPLRFSLGQLDRLEVARGSRSQWRKGAVIGFVPGAVLGGLLGVGIACDAEISGGCVDGSFVAGAGLVSAAVVGTTTADVGALAGLAFKSDRWVRLHDGKTRASLTLAPTEGGMRVGLSVSF